ncbi:molecular chaperone TorD family protein [Mycobacterium sp. THU-M104]|uniref:molecular chaperone TorD family protein n=1 Tax=Mycobacterium sp. THU-M104 TaxID=3410515 RepID=UPI003B9A21CB
MTTSDVLLQANTDRGELLRALGAIAYSPPPATDRVTDALGLARITAAEHTEAFILAAPPHAAIHLGFEGKLGGHGLDRIEGFWRAAGADPPADADHLGVLLMCYAGLRDTGADHDRRVADALLFEHIWPWAPGYLCAAADLGCDAITAWADLTLAVLTEEQPRVRASEALPLALRTAPDALDVDCEFDELLDSLITPIRCGMVLTHRALSSGAAAIGVGYRRGERRFALKGMLAQDKRATLQWLCAQAKTWATRHGERSDPTSQWWAARATRSATALATLAESAP